MSSIADLATMPVRKSGLPRKAGKWSSSDNFDAADQTIVYRHLYHYTTCMLTLQGRVKKNGNVEWEDVCYFCPGWGSVTDKQGVNKFLNAAVMPTSYRQLAANWIDARTKVVNVG
jgi:hypothetical protein